MMVAVARCCFCFSLYMCTHVPLNKNRSNYARANYARACSQRTASPNWTSSIVTGAISAPDWSAARVYAHTCFRLGVRERGEKNTRGEITVLGEFRKSEYTDIMLHRGEAGTLVTTWSCSLCQVSEGY